MDAHRDRKKLALDGTTSSVQGEGGISDTAKSIPKPTQRERPDSNPIHMRSIPSVPTERAEESPIRQRRIPFDRQIVAQAPPGAAGYRLVFPTGARGETIRIAPTIEPSGALSYWSLAPFQLPDDLRIQDGHSYRILWVDGLGRPLAPQGTTHLPALQAFLGPPDAEATAEDARYASMLRDVTSPELRAKAEAAVLESRLAEIRLQQNEVLLKQSIAMSDATARSEKSAAETAQQIRKEQREAQAISDAQREKKAAASAIEYARIDKRNKQILAALGLGIPALSALALWLVPKLGGQAGHVPGAVTAMLNVLSNSARAVTADATDTKTAVRAADLPLTAPVKAQQTEVQQTPIVPPSTSAGESTDTTDTKTAVRAADLPVAAPEKAQQQEAQQTPMVPPSIPASEPLTEEESADYVAVESNQKLSAGLVYVLVCSCAGVIASDIPVPPSASELSTAEWSLIRKVACNAKLMRVYEAEYLRKTGEQWPLANLPKSPVLATNSDPVVAAGDSASNLVGVGPVSVATAAVVPTVVEGASAGDLASTVRDSSELS